MSRCRAPAEPVRRDGRYTFNAHGRGKVTPDLGSRGGGCRRAIICGIDPISPHEFEGLLAGARANAPWAWDRLYRAFAPRVLGYLRLRNAQAAEDLLGDCFLDVVRGIDRFAGGPEQFGGWVLRIAHSRLVDDHRRSSRRAESPVADPPEVETSDTADVVAERDAARRMERLLRVLPDDQRTAAYLRSVLDLPFAEVARVMGRSEGSVKMLHGRALRTLADRLDTSRAGADTTPEQRP
ncbi:MAG: polymerase, sigma-24 subunit, subfamily [Thermoleophilia bacterium]|nr:polymerase, sigma-24 subunit, subfamily [Thermoleophilia bacterium]